MGIITSIQSTKTLVTIYADGRLLSRVRKKTFDQKPLEEGDAIDEEAYLMSLAPLQFSDAYETALSSLDFSARTASEIRRVLLKKGYVESVIDPVIEKLTDARLINDSLYAQHMAQSASSKPVGLYALKRKMRAKGLSDEHIEDALSALDPDQQLSACRQTAEKLAHKYASLDPRAARAKLSQSLARRGYPWEAITQAIEGMYEDEWE